ncbi:hypothetical protein SUGI_1028990 [Cryptomeria japonica]|nr:hypothetical protein SUGI_1028990 [Cryptomeria japonica]
MDLANGLSENLIVVPYEILLNTFQELEKPVMCWPFFTKHPTNRRFVDDFWKVSYEMRKNILKEDVEALVRKLMNLEDKKGKEMRVRLRKFKDRVLH